MDDLSLVGFLRKRFDDMPLGTHGSLVETYVESLRVLQIFALSILPRLYGL